MAKSYASRVKEYYEAKELEAAQTLVRRTVQRFRSRWARQRDQLQKHARELVERRSPDEGAADTAQSAAQKQKLWNAYGSLSKTPNTAANTAAPPVVAPAQAASTATTAAGQQAAVSQAAAKVAPAAVANQARVPGSAPLQRRRKKNLSTDDPAPHAAMTKSEPWVDEKLFRFDEDPEVAAKMTRLHGSRERYQAHLVRRASRRTTSEQPVPNTASGQPVPSDDSLPTSPNVAGVSGSPSQPAAAGAAATPGVEAVTTPAATVATATAGAAVTPASCDSYLSVSTNGSFHSASPSTAGGSPPTLGGGSFQCACGSSPCDSPVVGSGGPTRTAPLTAVSNAVMRTTAPGAACGAASLPPLEA